MAELFPFSATAGQPQTRFALQLVAIDPGIDGVLIRGTRGTAKSTMMCSLTVLLPPGRLRVLVLGAVEGRLAGDLDLGATLIRGAPRFLSGLLAKTHGGIFHVDEVNLPADHLTDLVLDAMANRVILTEWEGFSHTQQARFALVGTVDPEEGTLRLQLLDRFSLCVQVDGSPDLGERVEIMTRRLVFGANPRASVGAWANQGAVLAGWLCRAWGMIPTVWLGRDIQGLVATWVLTARIVEHRVKLVAYRAVRAHTVWRDS